MEFAPNFLNEVCSAGGVVYCAVSTEEGEMTTAKITSGRMLGGAFVVPVSACQDFRTGDSTFGELRDLARLAFPLPEGRREVWLLQTPPWGKRALPTLCGQIAQAWEANGDFDVFFIATVSDLPGRCPLWSQMQKDELMETSLKLHIQEQWCSDLRVEHRLWGAVHSRRWDPRECRHRVTRCTQEMREGDLRPVTALPSIMARHKLEADGGEVRDMWILWDAPDESAAMGKENGAFLVACLRAMGVDQETMRIERKPSPGSAGVLRRGAWTFMVPASATGAIPRLRDELNARPNTLMAHLSAMESRPLYVMRELCQHDHGQGQLGGERHGGGQSHHFRVYYHTGESGRGGERDA